MFYRTRRSFYYNNSSHSSNSVETVGALPTSSSDYFYVAIPDFIKWISIVIKVGKVTANNGAGPIVE